MDTPTIIFTGFAVITALITALTALVVLLLEAVREDRSGLRLFFYSVSLIISSICFVGYTIISLGHTIPDGSLFRPMMPILFAIVSSALVHAHTTREQKAIVSEQNRIIEVQREKLRRLEKRMGTTNV